MGIIMHAHLSDTQRRLHNIATIGTVFAINTSDQTMRLDVGELQTDWLPIPTISAGLVRIWRCPSIGEQFLLLSPSGDLANAIPVISLFSEQNPTPSTDEHEIFIHFNQTDCLKIHTTDSQLHLTIATSNIKSNVNIDGNLKVTGTIHADGNITTDSDVIADVSLNNHTHGGVQGGRSSTGKPQ